MWQQTSGGFFSLRTRAFGASSLELWSQFASRADWDGWDTCLEYRKWTLHKPEATRRVGGHAITWRDLIEDLKTVGVRNWWRKSQDQDQWRTIVKEAKVHHGLWGPQNIILDMQYPVFQCHCRRSRCILLRNYAISFNILVTFSSVPKRGIEASQMRFLRPLLGITHRDR
jgi:hypothetical protein